jgi:hypothetical protein
MYAALPIKNKPITIHEAAHFEQEHHTDNYYRYDVLCIRLCHLDQRDADPVF